MRALIGLWLAALAAVCGSETFPSHPVRVIVPFAAGSMNDAVARVLSESLREIWGEPVIVLNKPGAGGTTGTAEAARAKPDGYTLVVANASLALDKLQHEQLPYDPERDLRPIALLAVAPMMLVVSPSVPASDLKQFIAYARGNREKLFYGSLGAGTLTHLMMELLKSEAQLDMVPILYDGSPRLLTDLVAGRLQATIALAPAVQPLIDAGKVNALAVTSARRSERSPNVPAFVEQGYKQLDAVAWMGLLAPAGIPEEIARKLSADAQLALRSPRVITALANAGFQVAGGTAEDFRLFMHSQIVKWTAVVQATRAQIGSDKDGKDP